MARAGGLLDRMKRRKIFQPLRLKPSIHPCYLRYLRLLFRFLGSSHPATLTPSRASNFFFQPSPPEKPPIFLFAASTR